MMHNVWSLNRLEEMNLSNDRESSAVLARRRRSAPGVDRKSAKETRNLQRKVHSPWQRKPHFGICFDVDGVLARGTIPIPAAITGFRKLMNEKSELRVPVVFVTNALNRNIDKANQIAGWLGTQISEQQMIQAQGPLEVFHKVHDKFCLIVGQGRIFDIAKELGFRNICTVEDVADAYPLLDMVDHDNRKRIATEGYVEKDMPRIEAVILMGEPKRWESSLQLLVDILKTDGKPNQTPEAVPENHLPVIACNMDLQFMDRACMPRYGHGAFLLCLEALYQKVTGRPLVYTALVGKPSEITMRYAEHCLSREASKLGIEEPLQRMYLIGDTPEVDIVGSNLYQRYIDRYRSRRISSELQNEGNTCKESDLYDPELPSSRQMPLGASFSKQTAEKCQSLLVCTGVYNPDVAPDVEGDEKNYQGHRDFPRISALYRPTETVNDVSAAIDYILEQEEWWPGE